MDCERDAGPFIWHGSCVVSDGVFRLVRDGCVASFEFFFVINYLIIYGNIAHFAENWGYLSVSPIIASTVFSLGFGRILDGHEGPPNKESLLSLRSGPMTQCTRGKECYVAALYPTVVACFVAMLLSLWAGLRDRRKIMDGVEVRSGREAGWEGGSSGE